MKSLIVGPRRRRGDENNRNDVELQERPVNDERIQSGTIAFQGGSQEDVRYPETQINRDSAERP